MQKLWFVTNHLSGTATREKCEALEAVFEERGLVLAGRTQFPDDDLPDGAQLDAAGIDTVVLFAGDGTINAALCKLGRWEGAFLILPGGTMNLLAKELHGNETDPHRIVHAAHVCDRRVALPFVEAGPHRAFVGLILGPAAHWFRAREEMRAHRLARLWRAVRFAWRKTFGGHGVRVYGAPDLRAGYQAVFVKPDLGGLEVDGIDAHDWSSIVELGWDWLTGDWVAARAVTHTRTDHLRVRGTRPVLALFDGEPETLEPRVAITSGKSLPGFIATRQESAE